MITTIKTIKNLRLVPLSVFIFDCSRLLFLLLLLSVNQKSILYFNLPLMMYAAPNALFPLMSFFLLIRYEVSRGFVPLYITGKALGLLCLFIWLFHVFGQIQNTGVIRVLWPVFLCAADLGTIMGMAAITPENNKEMIKGDE